jgi:DNA-binding transcriptional MerR regulator
MTNNIPQGETINLLTTTEVAAHLRASVGTLRYWRHRGIGPKGFRVGRRVVYDAAEVARWLDDQKGGQNA